MWCNVGFAETMNKFLDDKYKITKEIIVKFDTRAFKIFTLKKGNNVKVCSIKSKFKIFPLTWIPCLSILRLE